MTYVVSIGQHCTEIVNTYDRLDDAMRFVNTDIENYRKENAHTDITYEEGRTHLGHYRYHWYDGDGGNDEPYGEWCITQIDKDRDEV